MCRRDGSRLSEVPVPNPRNGLELGSSFVSLQPQPAAVRPPQSQGKTSGMRPFQDPSAKVAAKERVLKLETALAAMEGMEGPEVDLVRAAHKRAPRGREGGSSRRRSNQRVRVILGESPHSFGGVGHETSHCQPEHRNVGEEVGRLEGSGTGGTCPSGRRGRSAAVERFGFSVADADRLFAFRSNPRQSFRWSNAEEDVPPRRIYSSVR